MAGVNISGDDPEYESSEPYRELYRADVPVAIMKAFLRHADGTTYTITAHLTKVLEKV